MTVTTGYPEFLSKAVRNHPAWELIGKTREGGWHGQDAVSDAFREANMDYTLVSGTPTLALPDGTTIPFNKGRGTDKNVAVVRPAVAGDPTPRVLGMVSRNYFEEGLIQPMRLANIINPMAVRWQVTAVGSLDYGRRSFVALELGERTIEIFGPQGGGMQDAYNGFIFIVEDHAGGGAVQFFHGLMRLWCKNQFLSLISGKGAATKGLLRIPHHGLTADLLELRAKVEVAADNAAQREENRLKSMAAFALTEPMIDHILEKTYPDVGQQTVARIYSEIMPKIDVQYLPADDPTLVKVQIGRDEADAETAKRQVRVEAKREEARQAMRFYDEMYPALAGTAWSLGQAIVDQADHGGNRSDGVRASVLVGERAKAKINATLAISDVIGFK